MKRSVEALEKENQELRKSLSGLQRQLDLTSAELVNQASRVVEKEAAVRTLNEKVHKLAGDLKESLTSINHLKAKLEAKEIILKENREAAMPDAAKRYQGIAGLNPTQAAQKIQEAFDAKIIQDIQESSGRISNRRSRIMRENDEKQLESERMVDRVVNTVEDYEDPRHGIDMKATREKENIHHTKDFQVSRGEKTNKNIEDVLRSRNSEIDQKLKEIMKKSMIPMKFVRIGEGLYVFGSKRVNVKAINNKLAVRIGGGYMYIEEFIRVFAHQELMKLKTMKGEIAYSNIEDEKLPEEVEVSQIITDSTLNGQSGKPKELDKSQASLRRSSTGNEATSQSPLGSSYFMYKKEESLQKSPIEPAWSRSASVTYKVADLSKSFQKVFDTSLNCEIVVPKETTPSPNTSGYQDKSKHKTPPVKGKVKVENSPKPKEYVSRVMKTLPDKRSESNCLKESPINTRVGYPRKYL